MDVYSIVTERILTSLEAGIIPWHRPWITVGNGAYNQMTGHRYSILNQMLLNHGPGPYATFRQWAAAGHTLREGAKSDIVVFFKWPEAPKDDENTEENQEKQTVRRPVLRYYRVFHASQVDGEVQPYYPEAELYDTEPCEEAERLFYSYVKREGIRLEEELSNEAYYSPATDTIHIPSIRQYEQAAEYYSTVYHEVVHSAEFRLNRSGLQDVHFASETYSFKELIAEIGSACILNSLGIETQGTIQNSTAYIQGWCRQLNEKNNRKWIVQATVQAEKAVKFILKQ